MPANQVDRILIAVANAQINIVMAFLNHRLANGLLLGCNTLAHVRLALVRFVLIWLRLWLKLFLLL